MAKRQFYDKSFKERAVKLSYERSSAYGKNSFPGHGNERLTDEQRRIKELKKAIAFFSRTDK